MVATQCYVTAVDRSVLLTALCRPSEQDASSVSSLCMPRTAIGRSLSSICYEVGRLPTGRLTPSVTSLPRVRPTAPPKAISLWPLIPSGVL